MTCQLYRHFDDKGALLYVGVSASAPARTADHMAASPWASQIARIEVENLPDRDAVMRAEMTAIINEAPLHNKTWSLGTGDRSAVRFIIGALGKDAICARLGVTPHSVRFAKVVGSFSAGWYAGLLELCCEAGIACPMHVFNWKTTTTHT